MADETRGNIRVLERRLDVLFYMVPHEVAARTDLTQGAKLAYGILYDYWRRFDRVFPGQERLAEDMGAGLRSVNRYLNELVAAGYLLIEYRGLGLTNEYVLLEWPGAPSAKVADQARQSAAPGLPDRQTIPLREKKKREREPVRRSKKTSDHPQPPEHWSAYRLDDE